MTRAQRPRCSPVARRPFASRPQRRASAPWRSRPAPPPRAEVVDVVLAPVAEERAAAGQREQLLHRGGELGIDERRPAEDPVLGPEAERDPAAADVDVALAESRDPERLVAA